MRVLGQVTYSQHPVDRHVHKPCTSPSGLWIPAWLPAPRLWTSSTVKPGGLGLCAVEVRAWLWTTVAEKIFSGVSAAFVALPADRLQVIVHPVNDHEEFEDHAVRAQG